MPRSKHTLRLSIASLPLLAAVALIFWVVVEGEARTQAQRCANLKPPMTLDLDCPALPNTIATGKKVAPGPDSVLDYDLFAWNSFIALNWPAVAPSPGNGFKRGYPDLNRSFATARPGDLTVWETYKEKREIFLANPLTDAITPNPMPASWNAAPQYGPPGAQVPMCDTASARRPARADSAFLRDLSHTTKVNSAFDALDETVEVASEARELKAAICVGHDLAKCRPGLKNATQVHTGLGGAVGPRVWRGQPARGGVPVVYEVKVNWDFYDYLANFRLMGSPSPLWVQSNAEDASKLGAIRLPARTSAARAPFQPGTGFRQNPSGQDTAAFKYGPNPIVTGYSASACASFDNPSHPCSQGSVHIKAAWVPLAPAEAASGDYHTTSAYVYLPNPDSARTGPICRVQSDFGLVGLHIIQRVHEQHFDTVRVSPTRVDTIPFPESGPRGGTFVFATWEHVSNDNAGFTYANYYPTNPMKGEEPQPYPNVDAGESALPLYRYYDLLPTTVAANQAVHGALGCPGSRSVWCNYRLIGTQYRPADPPPGDPNATLAVALPRTPLPNVESPPGSGQPYFLANLVIESNVGLQQFLGVPPGTEPIAHYDSAQAPPGGVGKRRGSRQYEIVANPDSTFNLTGYNLAWRIAPRQSPAHGQQSVLQDNSGSFQPNPNAPNAPNNKQGVFNMGGCMGCHGIAQIRGYSFSFVLLGNQKGALPDTQEHFDIPPPLNPDN